jgi:phosphatidylethanolamine-binding protein (PEBP) family uncharacterized protein
MQSEQHFSRRQRALCHRKKETFKNVGAWPPCPPPGSYAPDTHHYLFNIRTYPIILSTCIVNEFRSQTSLSLLHNSFVPVIVINTVLN